MDHTTTSLMIAGGGLAAVMAATISLRRRRASSYLRNLAAKRGWKIVSQLQEDWPLRLSDVALMHVGHSRRVGPTFQTSEGLWLFSYVFETGFEHRRGTHTWRSVVYDVDHGCSRAAVTRQDWLVAAATSTITDRIHLTNHQTAPDAPSGPIAIVEDRAAWDERMGGGLRTWFTGQPAERSWEFLPKAIVGYEPGEFREEAVVSLAESAVELARICGATVSIQESSESSASADGAELTVG